MNTDKPKRIQLSRKKGWRLPPNTVVVARPSKWGNPFKIGDDVPGLPGVKIEREDAVHYFSIFLPQPAGEIRAALRGKNLACWCQLGQPCHADVLLEIANSDGPINPCESVSIRG